MISKKRILVLIFMMMILTANFPTNSASSKDLDNDKIPPIIEHEPQKATAAYSSIKIETKITDDISIPTAKLFYKKDHDEKFASVTMSTEDSVRFTAEIPAMDVESSIIYYIESSDGTNIVKSANYTMTVARPNVDFSKIPMFLVTEIVPDSTNISGVDGYELIKILILKIANKR